MPLSELFCCWLAAPADLVCVISNNALHCIYLLHCSITYVCQLYFVSTLLHYIFQKFCSLFFLTKCLQLLARLLITNALPYITLLQQHTQISCNMYAVSGPGPVTHCGPRSHSRGGELLQLLSVSSELLPKFSFCQAQAQLFGFSSAVLRHRVIIFFSSAVFRVIG